MRTPILHKIKTYRPAHLRIHQKRKKYLISNGAGSSLNPGIITNSKQNVMLLIALSLIFSGGVSNFYDRVMINGAVVEAKQ